MQIIKRSGAEMTYDGEKIKNAVRKANMTVPESARLSDAKIAVIEDEVRKQLEASLYAANVEEIQDMVVAEIGRQGHFMVQKAYTEYRFKRELVRKANTTDDAILAIIDRNNEEVKQENSNKDPIINSTQRDYIAGEVSKDLTRRVLLPEDVVKAHDEGILHFHDADYFLQKLYNCCLVDMAGIFNHGNDENGGITTVISGTGISTPHSLDSAANIATQIVAQVASNQYGGQTWSLTDLVGGRHETDINFVDVSRRNYRKVVAEEMAAEGIEVTAEQINNIAEKRVRREIQKAVQTIQYQLITLMTTNGQTPFVTQFMYLNECVDEQKKADLAMLIEETLKLRIKGIQDEKGNWITPAFPKLIYVLEEDNITEGSKYWELTKLAAKCTAKRMVPDYISEKVMKELKNGDCYAAMGCRSFLTPDIEGLEENGDKKYYGRFNQGVITLNLPDIACSSGKDEKKFWEIFEERMDLLHKGLRARHERLLGTPSDVAPMLWQHGAIARLQPGEVIDKLLYNNYSTISIGYAGLAETVYYMKGISHTSEEGEKFGLQIMQYMNDKAKEWRAAENISYSVYGTPIEAVTYKFAKALQKRWGKIPGVSDRNYITNSYHVHVTEQIDAFDKLSKEAKFQALSPGGWIKNVA